MADTVACGSISSAYVRWTIPLAEQTRTALAAFRAGGHRSREAQALRASAMQRAREEQVWAWGKTIESARAVLNRSVRAACHACISIVAGCGR